MSENSKIDEYINSHPRECLFMLIFGLAFIWLSVASVLGLACYFVLYRLLKIKWWVILSAGFVMAAFILMLYWYQGLFHVNQSNDIHAGFLINVAFWKYFSVCGLRCATLYICQKAQVYILGFPIMLAGILSAIDLIKDNPHKKIMTALQNGNLISNQRDICDRDIDLALSKLNSIDANGTLLGVSKETGNPVILSDRYVNQMVLVLGTTGSGKTITLRRFHQRAISQGYPLIVVDGKPTDDNVEWLMNLAQKHNRPFYGFNCGNYLHYDPLANGGYTELKDKIISLKDQWENDYYRSIAEDYLQTTFEALLQSKQPLDLELVTKCLNYNELINMTRDLQNQKLLSRVASLREYDRKDITGLQAHLNLLLHSELGQYFGINVNTFTLQQAVQSNAIVYFALPALRFPSFSRVLGKLVINDLKTVIDRSASQPKPVFMVFDEFSVFAGEQVLNLVNMGRGKGVHAIFGTQGLADLDKVDVSFKSQVLNCMNTLICHRLNDQESAESVANWIGTRDAFIVTAQLNTKQCDAEMGSVSQGKEFIVHPDEIKQGLRTGEVYLISKVGGFSREKVRIVYL